METRTHNFEHAPGMTEFIFDVGETINNPDYGVLSVDELIMVLRVRAREGSLSTEEPRASARGWIGAPLELN